MHYANGREAQVGDQVIGRVYNTPGIVAGTLVSATPGLDSCNAEVEFFKTTTAEQFAEVPRMAISPKDQHMVVRGTERHGADGPKLATYRCRDYTQVSNLLHADDAHAAYELERVESCAKVAKVATI